MIIIMEFLPNHHDDLNDYDQDDGDFNHDDLDDHDFDDDDLSAYIYVYVYVYDHDQDDGWVVSLRV